MQSNLIQPVVDFYYYWLSLPAIRFLCFNLHTVTCQCDLKLEKE